MNARKHNLTTEPSEQVLVITRVIAAPRNFVFKAWTEPERVRQWWGPNGFTMPACTIDLRVGGVFHSCMRSSEGRDYWGKGIYREIVAAERLVFTDSFSDAEGNLVEPAKYGMPEWPAETLITVTFSEAEGKTILTLRHDVPESLAERNGARQGWSESLDRLAAYVEAEAQP